MNFQIFCIILLLQFALSDNLKDQQQYRQLVKEKNRAIVDSHNSNPISKFTMKLYEKYASYTFQEIQGFLLNTKMKSVKQLMVSSKPQSNSLLGGFRFGSEMYINWTERQIVSPVTDQGYCGSCYAHAAVSDIQASFKLRNIKVNLSIQQIVDCSWKFGNYGCYGGWMGQVFDYVKLNGITTKQNYPDRNETFFQGRQGRCEQKKGQFKIRGHAYTSYRMYDCESLTNMVKKRPVTVAVSANIYFIFYHRGIFDSCSPIYEVAINHAVLLVGINENQRQNYWIIKNSWGVTWGEQGYMRLDRFKDYGNHCQICLAPHYSII